MKRKVAYIYEPEIEAYNFGPDHPMKPKKVAMTHDIVEKSDLLHFMDLYRPPKVGKNFLTTYHSDEYIDYMENYFENEELYLGIKKYGIGLSSDTPAFPKMYEFCKTIGGSALLAAEILIQ